MINLTLQSLQNHLKQKKLDSQIQENTQQLYLALKIDEKEYPLFIRIYESTDLLQILVFIPCTLKEEAFGDLARLLHLLNKELDIPGFGMDEKAGVVFYRQMIPTTHKKIEEELFDGFITATETVCKTFSPAIEAVAFAAITFKDIIKRKEEMEKQFPAS